MCAILSFEYRLEDRYSYMMGVVFIVMRITTKQDNKDLGHTCWIMVGVRTEFILRENVWQHMYRMYLSKNETSTGSI